MQVKNFTRQAGWWLIALWGYLGYLIRHKWYVFVAGLRMGVPLWQLIIHDWSKFLPSELLPYAWYFNGPEGKRRRADNAGKHYKPNAAYGGDAANFARAWQLHLHRNLHHWQHWILVGTDNECLPMPIKYIREMLADWVGAGKAQGFNDMPKWYSENKDKMILHPETREIVELLVNWWKLGRPKGWPAKLPKDEQ